MTDEFYMKRALQLARRGERRTGLKPIETGVGEETTGIDIYLLTSLPEHNYLPAVAR